VYRGNKTMKKCAKFVVVALAVFTILSFGEASVKKVYVSHEDLPPYAGKFSILIMS